MKTRALLVPLLLAICSPTAWAKITVMPSAGGKAVAIAASPTPGRWIVVRAAPFGFVTGIQYLKGDNGVSACVWEGESGLYGVMLFPTDESLQPETAEVMLGAGPSPPVPPQPPAPPLPAPIAPDGYLGFTKEAYTAARETVTNPAAYAICEKLANNYLSVAMGMAQLPPVYATVSDAFDDLRKRN